MNPHSASLAHSTSPPGAIDVRRLSALELAAAIRAGRLGSREVVERHIEQIQRVNPTLNAVVRDRFELARREADDADALRSRVPAEALPPLHGVPCTIKELIAVAGMPQTAGAVFRRHHVADQDATVVARLRRAGAIVLGVTNVSELGLWMESYNMVYGRTKNPHDPGRTAGGSSGGEAAIVAAGGSPFGIGSDTGGSIRTPCFFNGVFGHKATGGLVPSTGNFPQMEGAARRFLVVGPITRSAADLMPLLRVIAGPDGQDEVCDEFALGDPAEVALEGRTLLNVVDNGQLRVDPDLRRAQQRAVAALAQRGMRVRDVQFAALRKQFEIWTAMVESSYSRPYREVLGDGRPIRPAWELLKFLLGRSDHMAISSVVALVDWLPRWTPRRTARLLALGRALREQILAALGDDGILVYPSYTKPAPRHVRPVLEGIFLLRFPFAYTGIFNALEMPVTQVPLGRNRAGLPLGVQVAARHGQDHATIAVAQALEDEFGGWTPALLD